MRVIGKIWRVDRGMDIESAGNMFTFHFRDENDMRRVVSGGPWSFDDAFIALEKPQGKGTIVSLDFNWAEFWVQIYQVPLLCMSKEIGWFLGGMIGDVMDVDGGDVEDCVGKFMRVKVRVDIKKPLKRCLRVDILGDGNETIMVLRYERLPNRCFKCGWLRASGPFHKAYNRDRKGISFPLVNARNNWRKPPAPVEGGVDENQVISDIREEGDRLEVNTLVSEVAISITTRGDGIVADIGVTSDEMQTTANGDIRMDGGKVYRGKSEAFNAAADEISLDESIGPSQIHPSMMPLERREDSVVSPIGHDPNYIWSEPIPLGPIGELRGKMKSGSERLKTRFNRVVDKKPWKRKPRSIQFGNFGKQEIVGGGKRSKFANEDDHNRGWKMARFQVAITNFKGEILVDTVAHTTPYSCEVSTEDDGSEERQKGKEFGQ
ncbi:hypothetical protein EZV62_015447 [Acer yangbiense]|uniref:DUF4283 domain-containing protein n=1 Tax=Acer yangbiense TaxID=1000413 RepID=A0A5C7HL74_9ROSI|nr:hypothetical protein EZV62_015447 [Acer yangbiense]